MTTALRDTTLWAGSDFEMGAGGRPLAENWLDHPIVDNDASVKTALNRQIVFRASLLIVL